MFSLLPPIPVGKLYITDVPFFNAPIASLNFDVTSLFTSCPTFLILGAKKMCEASLIAISIGSRASKGSSSINDLTLGYVRAISGFNLIAILADSSINETFEPLSAIEDAM
jgi:hypothetical protein